MLPESVYFLKCKVVGLIEEFGNEGTDRKEEKWTFWYKIKYI